jgi:hypothetical protein
MKNVKHTLELSMATFAATRIQILMDLLSKVNLVTSTGIVPIKLLFSRDKVAVKMRK